MFKDLVAYTNNLCGPAYIYFIFAAWSFVFLVARMFVSGKINLSPIALRLAVSYVIIYSLNWFCSKGWENFSWFLLYWMFAFVLIVLIGYFVLANKILDKTNIKFINLNQNQN
jgi:hypothetical protein